MYTKFEKCIKCNKIGESCVPNLMLLSFSDLLQWWSKRQKHLEWTNQTLADRSTVPVGTINRIKAGEYQDCKYSTIKNILIALIGGTTDEFACTDQVEAELRHLERLEKQAEKMAMVEQGNIELKAKLSEAEEKLRTIEEQHRKDVRVVMAEYKEEIAFLREQLKAWQMVSEKKGT